MPEYTKNEALAFVDAIRVGLGNRTGFKWLVVKLSDLAAYIGSIADENERLNAYLDSADLRDSYESYREDAPR